MNIKCPSKNCAAGIRPCSGFRVQGSGKRRNQNSFLTPPSSSLISHPSSLISHPSSSAFTIVELLVVIAIIGLLIALLMPAVQQAREAGRRSQCSNYMKQIGLAYGCHESVFQSLPPAYITKWSTPPADPTLPPPTVGWGIFLLPYLELRTTYDHYNFNLPFYNTNPAAEFDNQRIANTSVVYFQCPSAPIRKPYDYTFSYPGYPDITWQAAPADYSPIEAISPDLDSYLSLNYTDDQRKGVLEPDKNTPMRVISDGASHTILVAEIAGKNDLWQNGHSMGQKITGQYAGQGGWADPTSAATKFVGSAADASIAPGPFGVNCSNDFGLYAFHRTVDNALFADGSVQAIVADVDIKVLVAMITRAGGELDQ